MNRVLLRMNSVSGASRLNVTLLYRRPMLSLTSQWNTPTSTNVTRSTLVRSTPYLTSAYRPTGTMAMKIPYLWIASGRLLCLLCLSAIPCLDTRYLCTLRLRPTVIKLDPRSSLNAIQLILLRCTRMNLSCTRQLKRTMITASRPP